jgi:hypothetical protein
MKKAAFHEKDQCLQSGTNYQMVHPYSRVDPPGQLPDKAQA